MAEIALRRGRRWRYAAAFGASALLLAGVILASIALGAKALPMADVWAVLNQTSTDAYAGTVVDERIQRTALAVTVGVALAVSGTLMQTVTQNPLADPGLLGVNAGAGAAMLTGAAVLGVSAGTTGSALLALLGAIAAAVVVMTIGTAGGGGASMVRLVLAGAVVTAVLTAYVQATVLRRPREFDSFRFWVVGSFGDGGFDALRTVAPFVVVGLIAALLCAGSLNALALGSDTATSLGVPTGLIRIGALGAATVLGAAATAAAGPIVFVGLAVPHIVRALVGLDAARQLAGAVLIGPIVLVGADVIGRVIIAPQQLMVGVVTAFVGAPVLLAVVRRLGSRAA